MKHLKTFENQTLNDILDKASSDGMNSLSDLEKKFLKNFNNEKERKNIQEEMEHKIYIDEIGPYEAKLVLYTETPNKQYSWSGKLTVNDIEYEGEIMFNGDNYVSSYFENDDSDLWTDLEGLEYDADKFMSRAFYELNK